MRIDVSFPPVLGRQHPLRRLAMRDLAIFAILALITLALFAVTGLYYSAYSRYRTRLGLPTDNTPVITLPVVRRHG